jgi:DNA-binding transcriptional MocR family regulator
MTNLFLKVNKDLFSIGLAPIEILIVAQVLEYQTKGMECFESDESFAKDFGMSVSTVSRAIGALKKRGILGAETKNIQRGKLRYLTVNTATIDDLHKQQNDDCENSGSEVPNSQNAHCGMSKLPISTEQNDLIKDKLKDNSLKDNGVMNQPQAADCITLADAPRGKVEAVSEVMKNSTDDNGGFKF